MQLSLCLDLEPCCFSVSHNIKAVMKTRFAQVRCQISSDANEAGISAWQAIQQYYPHTCYSINQDIQNPLWFSPSYF